jgi:hypothetical protein
MLLLSNGMCIVMAIQLLLLSIQLCIMLLDVGATCLRVRCVCQRGVCCVWNCLTSTQGVCVHM